MGELPSPSVKANDIGRQGLCEAARVTEVEHATEGDDWPNNQTGASLREETLELSVGGNGAKDTITYCLRELAQVNHGASSHKNASTEWIVDSAG